MTVRARGGVRAIEDERVERERVWAENPEGMRLRVSSEGMVKKSRGDSGGKSARSSPNSSRECAGIVV